MILELADLHFKSTISSQLEIYWQHQWFPLKLLLFFFQRVLGSQEKNWKNTAANLGTRCIPWTPWTLSIWRSWNGFWQVSPAAMTVGSNVEDNFPCKVCLAWPLFVESTVPSTPSPVPGLLCVVNAALSVIILGPNPKQWTTPVPCNMTSELHSSNPLMSRDTGEDWARGGFMNCATQTGQRSSVLCTFLSFSPDRSHLRTERQREGGDGARHGAEKEHVLLD